jgi:hypothetical protein
MTVECDCGGLYKWDLGSAVFPRGHEIATCNKCADKLLLKDVHPMSASVSLAENINCAIERELLLRRAGEDPQCGI